MASVPGRIGSLRDAVRRCRERVVGPVRADLAADPTLRYLLALAVLTCGFGIWFRLPNFAVPDEYSRLIQPMKVAGRVVADPSFESLRAAVTDGRALGATFYIYAAVLAPVFLIVFTSGQLGEFARLGTIQSRWDLWHAAPAWFWTSAVLLSRLVSVALGVGCVYLTYRLGTELRDRFAGRLAALFLALSIGFLAQTHLVGEDVPMLFLLLLATVLAHSYVVDGRTSTFLLGALAGGLAIAFKLSGGVAAVVLGAALIVRAARSDDPTRELLRPDVILGGMAVGTVAIYVGFPSVLVGGLDELIARITREMGTKAGKSGGFSASIWYWFGYQYVSGLGIPLFVGVFVAFAATVLRLVAQSDEPVSPLKWLLLVAVLFPLAVYSRWEFVRLRHVVPSFPLLLVFLGTEVSRWRHRERAWRAVRVGVAVLLVTTAFFAGVAESQYLSDPRDEATQWIESNTAENATLEVYENSIADVGTPHGRKTIHYSFPEEQATNTSDLVLNDSSYTDWMLSMPDREPDYIQLTANELDYVDPSATDYRQYPERREYVRGLLDGEYDYRVVARFGETGNVGETGALERLLDAGLTPDMDGLANRIVLLERLDHTGTRADQRAPDADHSAP